MKLNFAVFVALIMAVFLMSSSLQSQPKELPASGPAIEYAMLYQQKEKVQAKDHVRNPYLTWQTGNERHVVTGEADYKELLKEMGKEYEKASLLDLLNYLGSQRWELCATTTNHENEPGQIVFIFKRQSK